MSLLSSQIGDNVLVSAAAVVVSVAVAAVPVAVAAAIGAVLRACGYRWPRGRRDRAGRPQSRVDRLSDPELTPAEILRRQGGDDPGPPPDRFREIQVRPDRDHR